MLSRVGHVAKKPIRSWPPYEIPYCSFDNFAASSNTSIVKCTGDSTAGNVADRGEGMRILLIRLFRIDTNNILLISRPV